MLKMIAWISATAVILIAMYYLGYLFIFVIRKLFKAADSKLFPQTASNPVIPLKENSPISVAYQKRNSMVYLMFSIVIVFLFGFIIYQEWQIQILSKKLQKIESMSTQSDLQYEIDSLESELSHLDSRIDDCESDIEELKNYNY